MSIDKKRLREQVRAYKVVQPVHKVMAETLREVLEAASDRHAPQAIVGARAKALSSFAEKIIRKGYREPMVQMTDLCGARVITNTHAEMEQMCLFIKQHFDIDEANSMDVASRLRVCEFGYLSVHYIVSFRPGAFPNEEVSVKIPKDILKAVPPLKAEIQVRTVLQHGWAAIGHDRVYKSPFEVPKRLVRESHRLAAVLEEADQAFARLAASIDAHQTSYGAYMTSEQIREELAIAEYVLECDRKSVKVAHRVARLAISLGEWEKVVRVLSRYVNAKYAPVLRDLGVAMCKQNAGSKAGKKYKEGQKHLRAAIALDPKDADALASLAGTYKGTDAKKALALYQQAFEVDSADPYPLGCYLEQKIANERSTAFVSLMRPTLLKAIDRCREQADIGINLPWAFFDIGKFHLLLGQPYDGLTAYAKGIQLSTSADMIESALGSINLLKGVRRELPELEWARRLLLIALAGKFPGKGRQRRLRKLATKQAVPIKEPVVIVAGGCDATVKRHMAGYRQLLLDAFSSYAGTIISGGTTSGASGIVGAVGARYCSAVHTIGYLPKRLPRRDKVDQVPSRYREIRRTDGEEYSGLDPLQPWIDMLCSGIDPSDVKLLAVNGGRVTALECRVARAMGAQVGIIQDSGREADKLTVDPDWADSGKLALMPADMMTIKTFIDSGTRRLDATAREILGRGIHVRYQRSQFENAARSDPSMTDWDNLPDGLRESNLQQADDIERKLRAIGCTIHPVKDREVVLMKFSKAEIEKLAEIEHARWTVERLLDGWRQGPRDVHNKISPYLVSWEELPGNIKKYDLYAVVAIPELLAALGLEVRRQS